MARIEPRAVLPAEDSVQRTLDGLDQAFGQRLAPAQIQALCPSILDASAALSRAPASSGHLPAGLRSLVILRTAEIVGDPYCIQVRLDRAAEADVSKLRSVSAFRSSPLFGPQERAALGLAEAMTQTPATVPDTVFAEARQYFDDVQLVELAATIAMENYRARFNRAFAIEPPGAQPRAEQVHRDFLEIDRVTQASMESFPASDAPGWISDQIG